MRKIVVCFASFCMLASLGCAGLAQIASDVCRVPFSGSKAEKACDKLEELILKSEEPTAEAEAE